MDNKQNRSFYWEVKDFLNKKPETFEQKKSSLKDSIVGILNENNLLRSSSFSNDAHMTQDVSKYLRTLSGEEKKYDPGHPSYAKNSTVNPFTLNEYASPKAPRRSQDEGSPGPEDMTVKDVPMLPGAKPVGPSNQSSQPNMQSDINDPIAKLRDARGMLRSTATYNRAATGSSDNREERKAENDARNAAIKTATIGARQAREELKAKWNAARAVDPSSPETIQMQKQLRSMYDEINPSSPQQGNIKQSDVALRYAPRDQNAFYAKMKDKNIQGTNMTYGEYKSKFGKEYNALDKGESSMLNKVAGAGRYGSEEARQNAVSSYQFNQTYDKQNTAMAQKSGELTRQVDQSQVELDRFQNMTPAERQAAARKEIADIQARPGFVADVAQSSAAGIRQGQAAADSAASKADFDRRARQPGRVGTPSLLANPNAPAGIARDPRMPITPDLLAAQEKTTPQYGGAGSLNYGKAPTLISRPGQTPPDLIRRR
jgi:hypothetical protein